MPTIGVSIAIPDPWGAQLQDYRIALGDEGARHIPSHITLLPPHVVAADELDEVVAHLKRQLTGVAPFRVHLRGTGSFRPVSPVVFVNVVEGISQCEQLTGLIRQGPLDVDSNFPYHPHVTVAHELAPEVLDRAFAELGDFEATFVVTDVWMYLHDDQSGWLPDLAFPLLGC